MRRRTILFLTTADSEILALSRAAQGLPPGFPRVRGRNPAALPDSWDPAVEVGDAALVLIRLLGGRRAWETGFDRLRAYCKGRGIPLLAWSGEQHADAELAAASTVPAPIVAHGFEYLRQGGVENLRQLLRFLADTLLLTGYGFEPPAPLPQHGIYHPAFPERTPLDTYLAARWIPGRPGVGVLWYRSHWASGNRAFVDALIAALEAEGCNVLPVYCYSVRNEAGPPGVFAELLLDGEGRPRVDCLVSTMSYSMGSLAVHGATVAEGWSVELLDRLDIPIIQAIAATTSRRAWEASDLGLTPFDTATAVAIPEFDGRVITVPISFKEVIADDPAVDGPVKAYVPAADRVRRVAGLAARFARLRRTPNREKRIAILLSNYPTKAARIGNAVGLDTPASLVRLLHALRDAGYDLGPNELPDDGDALIHALIDAGTYDREFVTEGQLREAPGLIPAQTYRQWFSGWPEQVRSALEAAWGAPPGRVYAAGGALAVLGLRFGNVFIGIQPPRGFGENPIAIYHSPDLVPTHHYLACYRWLRETFRADAVIHLGKHGTLEWLPGKAIGLSAACYPDVALADLPLVYPFIINDPGEGTQAKRRTHAVIVDHLMPAMTRADTYDDLARLEQLLDEYYQVQTLDPAKLPRIREQIWRLVVDAELHHDLGADGEPGDFDAFLLHLDGYLCELKDARIRDGLHILGEAPAGEQRIGTLLALLRLDTGDVPALRAAVARAAGLDERALLADPGARFSGGVPAFLAVPDGAVHTHADVLDRLEAGARRLLEALDAAGWAPDRVEETVRGVLGSPDADVCRTLRFVCETLVPNLERTRDEVAHVLRFLDGGYVPAGPSGAPTRGLAHILPTGRNFYSVDPKAIPSPTAYAVGAELARELVARYVAEEGRYPESVGIVVWGTAAMRTQGDDIGEVLALLGVRPVWQAENRRVVGIEVIPLAELGRPRIDVTLRISGFFRDAFPNLIHLLDEAVRTVALLNEPPEQNYVRKHYLEDRARLAAAGVPELEAQERSLYRIFGSKPGAYGAGILPLLDERAWRDDADLAEVYTAWGGYAYTQRAYGAEAREEFRTRFAAIAVAVKNQDNREHDIFDSDDYLQYHGGMVATVRALTGRNPRAYVGDSSDPGLVRVRDLQEEARRVFRARVVNPKWIAAMQRHGYKGAFELAATVDYLFGYDATARVVEDWMYRRLAERYVFDGAVQRFLREANPWALRGIIERLLEAADRGLWEQPDPELLDRLRAVYLDVEGGLEDRTAGGPGR